MVLNSPKVLILYSPIKVSRGLCTFILVYVDDLLITGDNSKTIVQINALLHEALTIKDLGLARYFLGIEIARSSSGTLLNQRKYILDILFDAGLTAAKPAQFPMAKGFKLSIEEGTLLPNPEAYRRIVGRLLYLTLTRPDISYAVQHLSQFLQAPKKPHYDAALHVLRYLKGTVNKGLFYPKDSGLQVTAYCDADWGNCRMSARSLTGYCVFLGSSLVSWKTKKQKTMAKSTVEAEYRSMSATTSELEWISYILHDLQVPVSLPFTLYCDNKVALHIAENPVFHETTKHLRIDCHYTRDKLLEGFLKTAHVSSQDQLADIMTKPLSESQHNFIGSKLGLMGTPPTPG